ncbi:MAG: hypothetical protein ACM35H_11075 [Bacteroidota bacterium]
MAAHGSLPDRSHSAVPAAVAETVYCFSILAAAEPGVMPRVLELFAKRGLTPTRWHSDVVGPRADELSIDIQVHGLDIAAGDYIARCLRQVYQVETVLTSQKHVGQKQLGRR